MSDLTYYIRFDIWPCIRAMTPTRSTQWGLLTLSYSLFIRVAFGCADKPCDSFEQVLHTFGEKR
jgi:hypothetical protein